MELAGRKTPTPALHSASPAHFFFFRFSGRLIGRNPLRPKGKKNSIHDDHIDDDDINNNDNNYYILLGQMMRMVGKSEKMRNDCFGRGLLERRIFFWLFKTKAPPTRRKKKILNAPPSDALVSPIFPPVSGDRWGNESKMSRPGRTFLSCLLFN